MTAPSMQPPETEPANAPRSFTTKRLPGGLGDEPPGGDDRGQRDAPGPRPSTPALARAHPTPRFPWQRRGYPPFPSPAKAEDPRELVAEACENQAPHAREREAHERAGSRADPRGLSGARPASARAAARLPRQRLHRAEAPRGRRGSAADARRGVREHPSWRARAERDPRHRALRGGARDGAALSRRGGQRGRSSSRGGATESINLVAQSFGSRGRWARAIACSSRRSSITATWSPGRCSAPSAAPSSRSSRSTRAGSSISIAHRCADLSAHEDRRAQPGLQRARAPSHRSTEIIPLAHAAAPPCWSTALQAVPHLRVDVRALDCDFYVFSGHKLHGPPGTGVLYGKRARLAAMPPWQGGGDMILSVTLEGDHLRRAAAALRSRARPTSLVSSGMAAAIDYLEGLGFGDAIAAHEQRAARAWCCACSRGCRASADHRERRAEALPSSRSRSPAFTRTIVGTFLDHRGIAVRSGPPLRRAG
jgi:hypothetical protein